MAVKRSTWHILVLLLLSASVLGGCTVVSYCVPGQPCVSVADFHPAGGDVELLIRRSDGTVIWAARGQPSAESLITGVVSALNPTGVLLP